MNKDTDSKGIEKDTRDEYFEIIVFFITYFHRNMMLKMK
jgi:hypothetical protein